MISGGVLLRAARATGWGLLVLVAAIQSSCDSSRPIFELVPEIQVGGLWDFTFEGTWRGCKTIQSDGPIAPIGGMRLQQSLFDVVGESTTGAPVTFSAEIQGDRLVGTFQTCLEGTCPLGVPCLNQFVVLRLATPSTLTGTHSSAGINCVGCLAEGQVTGTRR